MNLKQTLKKKLFISFARAQPDIILTNPHPHTPMVHILTLQGPPP